VFRAPPGDKTHFIFAKAPARRAIDAASGDADGSRAADSTGGRQADSPRDVSSDPKVPAGPTQCDPAIGTVGAASQPAAGRDVQATSSPAASLLEEEPPAVKSRRLCVGVDSPPGDVPGDAPGVPGVDGSVVADAGGVRCFPGGVRCGEMRFCGEWTCASGGAVAGDVAPCASARRFVLSLRR